MRGGGEVMGDAAAPPVPPDAESFSTTPPPDCGVDAGGVDVEAGMAGGEIVTVTDVAESAEATADVTFAEVMSGVAVACCCAVSKVTTNETRRPPATLLARVPRPIILAS